MNRTGAFNRDRAARGTAAAVVAVVLLAGLSLLLLDHQAFVDWGFLIGPAAWLIACVVGARFAGLTLLAGVVGAVVAGVPSAAATLTGLHWLGVVVGLLAFAWWCGSQRAASL